MVYAVLADDLSGACDAGVEFACRGVRTIAWMAGRQPSLDADVHVLDTGSRGLRGGEATDAVRQVARLIKQRDLALIYKKIDSTLKGPVRAEIEALLASVPAQRVVVTPANPLMARIVKDGRLFVRGLEPQPPVDMAALLAGPDAMHVAIAGAIGPALAAGARIVSCDAATPEDLVAIGRAAAEAGALPVGSAGLAAAVAEALCGSPRSPREPAASEVVTVVAGSRNSVTSAQLEQLAGERGVTVTRIDLADRHVASCAGSAAGALLLTGGDTAAHVLRDLGAEGIEIAGEVVPGVHWGFMIGGARGGRVVATKPGGFGEPDTLVRACRKLQGMGA